ncbi:hypothetical protein ACWIUD_11370 [Helicobacter sp. 23-1044]
MSEILLLDSAIIAESTHPLTPSAREGGFLDLDSASEWGIEKAPPLAGGVWGGVFSTRVGGQILDSANRRISHKIAEFTPTSSLRGSGEATTKQFAEFVSEAKQPSTIKINPCEAPLNSPASWCKKSDSRLQKCNRRFFARSRDCEALPLKAKKRSFLARRGSGEGGAALFAKETNESNSKNSVDSAKNTKNAESNTESQNLNKDSSLVSHAQNDNFFVDCHDLPLANLAMTKTIQKTAESKIKNTHPLTPSAREGGFLELFSARVGGQILDSANRRISHKFAESNSQNKQSKELRCCFGLFLRETSEIGLGRPLSAVLCKNNSNEYPRPNCGAKQ